MSCAAGDGGLFEQALAGLGAEVVTAEEPERLGRGGGIRFAARERREDGDVYALNGDELLDIDFEALLAPPSRERSGGHDRRRPAAIAVRDRRAGRRRRRDGVP